MIIDPIVRSRARVFGGGSETFPMLIQAVIDSEGGLDRLIGSERFSTNPSTLQDAIDDLCRSAVHHLSDVAHKYYAKTVVDDFGASWAPIGAANDPRGLNVHWAPNVLALWTEKPV